MRKHLTPAIALLAALTSFGVVALGAQAVVGQDDADTGRDGHDIVGERVVVASGESKQFGRWELVKSRAVNGDPCMGIRLFRDAADGGASLSEGCGPDVQNQVGSIVAAPGKGGTLFFGQVSQSASAVVVRDGATRKLSTNAIVGADGKRYVAAEAAERLPGAVVELSDGSGRELGRVDSAAVAAR